MSSPCRRGLASFLCSERRSSTGRYGQPPRQHRGLPRGPRHGQRGWARGGRPPAQAAGPHRACPVRAHCCWQHSPWQRCGQPWYCLQGALPCARLQGDRHASGGYRRRFVGAAWPHGSGVAGCASGLSAGAQHQPAGWAGHCWAHSAAGQDAFSSARCAGAELCGVFRNVLLLAGVEISDWQVMSSTGKCAAGEGAASDTRSPRAERATSCRGTPLLVAACWAG